MKCPICQLNLDDTLDFTTDVLSCPRCGRTFSEREITALPIEQPRTNTYLQAEFLPYHLEWDLPLIPQWV